MKNFWKYREAKNEYWTDWKWQAKNRLTNNSNISDFFPNISNSEKALFSEYSQKFNLSLTPYILSLIEIDGNLNPLVGDPIWNQFRWLPLDRLICEDGYDGVTKNWELKKEMPTNILHHKYPDRVILRITNSCIGYCNYCYLTDRTLDINKKKTLSNRKKKLGKNIKISEETLSGERCCDKWWGPSFSRQQSAGKNSV